MHRSRQFLCGLMFLAQFILTAVPITWAQTAESREVGSLVPGKDAQDASQSIHTRAAHSYVYYVATVDDLDFVGDGVLSEELRRIYRDYKQPGLRNYIYVRGDKSCEAYLDRLSMQHGGRGRVRVALRTDKPVNSKATLLLPEEDGKGMRKFEFRITASDWEEAEKSRSFFDVMRSYYQELAQQNIPGAAWFRFRADLARLMQNGSQAGEANPTRSTSRSNNSEFDSTLDIFTGSRAVAENLQLDRVLEGSDEADDRIAIDSIRGVNVRAFDWSDLIEGIDPQVDLLAKHIPRDQHVFLFDSFDNFATALDRAQTEGVLLSGLLRTEPHKSSLLHRYQRQLGLSLSKLMRLMGPTLLDEIALTGSDLHYDLGTDVAILMATKQPQMVMALLESNIASSEQDDLAIKKSIGTIGNTEYVRYTGLEQELNCYLAQLQDVVVVTNSLGQLKRLSKVQQGGPSLLGEPEYKFFRDRYPIGQHASGRGLMIISDATIRRWCGPRWRIANSRRLFAQSALARYQAKAIWDSLGPDPEYTLNIDTPALSQFLGELTVDGVELASERFGSLRSLTPIVDLPMEKVSVRERDAYGRWRSRYERLWTQSFDPIALDFSLGEEQLDFDLSVLPLIAGSQYQFIRSLSGNAEVKPENTDPHSETMLHLSVALKKYWLALLMTNVEDDLPEELHLDPFAWFSETINFYVEEDNDYWKDFDVNEKTKLGFKDAPIAISFGIKEDASMFPFLIALRKFLSETAPYKTEWENLNYGEHKYFKVFVAERQGGYTFYYAIANQTLLFSPSEKLIQRAIDRQGVSEDEGLKNENPDTQVFGKHLVLRLNEGYLHVLENLFHQNYLEQLKAQSWQSLPILNEWQRFFPAENPVAFHNRYWSRELTSIDGGSYQWDAATASMASKSYGPPGTEVLENATIPSPLRDFDSAEFGLTFENNGLRARAQINLK